MSTNCERAQSEIIGTVLVLGISLAVIVVSVGVGGAIIAEATSDAETERMENTISQFSSQASLVALGESERKNIGLGSVNKGQIAVRENSGSVRIYQRDNGTESNITNGTLQLGAVVYENDGTEVAYQGGGVWKHDDGQSRMLSPPEYHYRSSTLTFPIVRVTGDGSTSGGTAARVSSLEVGSAIYPDKTDASKQNPLEDGVIVVEIQSDYYEGWYQFFNQRAEGSTTIDHENQIVVAELTVPQELTVDSAVAVQQSYNAGGNSGTSDAIQEGKPLPGINSTVASEVEDARTNNDNGNHSCISTSGFNGTCTLTAGTYFVDGDAILGDDLTINTSAGNVTIVTDGDLHLAEHEINVVDDSDNGVNYYVNGSLNANGNAYVGTDNAATEANRNVFYVTDQVLEESTGGGTIQFDAVIYAPNANIQTSGNLQINGAVYANDIDIGGNVEIDYDDALENFTFEVTGSETTITYLHVSENTVEVRFD